MLDAVFPPDPEEVARIVSQALAEDRAFHDVTTRALVPDDQEGQGTFLYKSGGVVCGMGVVEAAFAFVSDEIELDVLAPDGSVLESGQVAAEVRGPLEPEGYVLVGSTPAQFQQQILSEVARWNKVVKEAGIKGEG